MTFLLPLGFISLIAFFFLFLIYILKPKYEERKISSTFVWKLSLEYQKQKVPFQWLKSSLVLILQILTLIIAVLLLTKPMLLLSNDEGDRIIILESSASMMTQTNGVSRFEKAVDEISNIASTASNSKKITIILAGNEATYVVRREVLPEIVEQSLSNSNCELGEANIDDALSLAGSVKDENADASIILYGSKDYEDSGIVTVRNMSNNEWNAAILHFESYLENGFYQFETEIASFNKDTNLLVSFLVDGQTISSKIYEFKNNEILELNLSQNLEISSYDFAEVKIEATDALTYDNNFYLFGGNENKFEVQIVSDSSRFIKTALNIVGDCNFTDVRATPLEGELPEDYIPVEVQYEDFDLYIFDGYEPTKLPKDGAVWILNPLEGFNLKGLSTGNLIYGDVVNLNSNVFLSTSEKTDLSLTGQQIANYIDSSKISISKYTKLNSYDGFESILNYSNNPVLLTKNDNGVKLSVFSFDLAYSNLPMTIYMPMLIQNLYNYSLEHTVDQYLYNVGGMIELNNKPSVTQMTITINEDVKNYTSFPVLVNIDKPGVYNVSQELASGTIKEDSFFVRIPRNESDFDYVGSELTVPLLNPNQEEGSSEKQTYDLVFILAGLMLILVVVEWRVQYREQY